MCAISVGFSFGNIYFNIGVFLPCSFVCVKPIFVFGSPGLKHFHKLWKSRWAFRFRSDLEYGMPERAGLKDRNLFSSVCTNNSAPFLGGNARPLCTQLCWGRPWEVRESGGSGAQSLMSSGDFSQTCCYQGQSLDQVFLGFYSRMKAECTQICNVAGILRSKQSKSTDWKGTHCRDWQQATGVRVSKDIIRDSFFFWFFLSKASL